MWSLGCIAAELLCGKALFPCGDEYSCLERMILVIGTAEYFFYG